MAPRCSFGRGASHPREVPVPPGGVRVHSRREGQPRRDPAGTGVRPGPEPREGAGLRGARARGCVRSSRDRAGGPACPVARIPGVPDPCIGPGGHVFDPEVRLARGNRRGRTSRIGVGRFRDPHGRAVGDGPAAGECGFRLHFTDFLRFTNTMRETPWKLINQRVDRGYVILQRAKALRVMRNAIQRHIEEGLPLPVNEDIVTAFRTDLREIRGILEAKKATFKAEDIGKVSITRFPPCMYNLLAQIQNHENVPHMGRFAIVAFLHHIGLGNEEIYRVFGDVPDFAADVTRYQIEHITGTSSPTEYTPPECSTMKSYGICPGPDRICLTIKHPLSYYRIKGRDRRPRGESASTAT